MNYYKTTKQTIKRVADNLGFDDLPARRQELNGFLDFLIREIDTLVLQDRLTEKRGEQYKTWLTDYVIKRHTK